MRCEFSFIGIPASFSTEVNQINDSSIKEFSDKMKGVVLDLWRVIGHVLQSSPNERQCRLDSMARLDESDNGMLRVLEGLGALGASNLVDLAELEPGDPREDVDGATEEQQRKENIALELHRRAALLRVVCSLFQSLRYGD
jgi:hypothetical protein